MFNSGRKKISKFLILAVFFVLIPLKSFAATTIFSDNFGSSYTTLASHVPTTVGTGYTLLINNGVLITVQSYNNHATVTANTSNAGSFYTVEGTYPDADYEISSSVNFAGGDSSYTRSMGLRVQDSNNMYLLRYGGSTMIMYKRVSGAWSTIGTAAGVSLAGNINSPYIGETVSFSAVGTTLTAKVNGVTKLTVTDSSITATGKAGIGLGYVNISTDDGGTGVGIDNVVVQTATSDSTAPTITSASSDKANGSYKAGEVIDIDVTFSEIVTSAGSVTVTLETGATDRNCTFTVTSASTGTCNYTVQAGDTTSDLTVNTISGTIADQASNAMSDFVPVTNLAANKALVIDTADPTLQSFAPADNETNFSPISVFLMVFNEAVDVETGNITIKKTSDDSTVETISVSGGLVTGTGTSTITIDPSTDLSDLTEYYILVDDTAFDDAAGNSYAGVSSTTAWSFTTGDINAPTLSSISASVSTTGATITWTTNEASSSSVSHGPTVSYTTTTAETDTSPRVTSHSVSITGLTCATEYNYIVISKDAANYTSSDTNHTFTTSSCPVVSSGGAVPVFILQQMSDNLRAQNTNQVNLTIQKELEDKESKKLEVLEGNTKKNIFTKNLKYGLDNEEDVRSLQKFLNANGFIVSTRGPGSPGNEINYFGYGTKRAVEKFQKKYFEEILAPLGNKTPTGYVGEYTRNKINKILNEN
ncbi:MAG: Ig-like domain-containing protein [Candidatus Pacebacteria bacterium]|nr:Ig-like domain-containing protein [Candidatus Paceibacterota bacterium]